MPLVPIKTALIKAPPTLKQSIKKLHKMKTAQLAKFIDDAGIVEELGIILNAQMKGGAQKKLSESKQDTRITRRQLRNLIIEILKGEE